MAMTERTCPYCNQAFRPCRFHPEQRVCSTAQCQQRRRADYHRKRLAQDPAYRDDCNRSRAKWRERNPDYLKRRPARPLVPKGEGLEHLLIAELRQVLKSLGKNSAKKNSALSGIRCAADFWLIAPQMLTTAKKNVANVQIIVVCGVSSQTGSNPVR